METKSKFRRFIARVGEVNLSKTDVSGTHFADMWVRLV